VPAATLLATASALSGVKIIDVPAGDILLDNCEASYDPEEGEILVSLGLSAEDRAFHISHEFGHHKLHHPKDACHDHAFDPVTAAEPEPSAVGDSDAYSPKQRREAQANVFGREFLLPRDRLREACLKDRLSAEVIAKTVGVSVTLVRQQMADALLLPEEAPAKPHGAAPDLDPSQRAAAEAKFGPVQVRAGPGTGKTRTLVARAAWLIDVKSQPAASILALTYSNASAEDLAKRLRKELGAQATEVWCSTFHAFGQEVLRVHGSRIGLPTAPTLVDRADALFLLEEEFERLELDHYFNLLEPLRGLKDVLGAISRAKDELCTPTGYLEAARAMPEGEDKAKALEVAHIYKVYDEALRAKECVDFGDLIMRAVELLSDHPEVAAEIRSNYRHILVDEYQDMNAASGKLLKLLADPATGPWVVGDVRQSIYRFRGASPLNMSGFAVTYPGAQTFDLEVNYRSGGQIVSLFDGYGRGMVAAKHASEKPLHPHHGPSAGEVLYRVAETKEAEAEGIARDIIGRYSVSAPYRSHAILTRTHGVLSTIAAHLERAGVPALYFGDFFERPEVRDLLSLVSLTGERDGVGLLRFAQLPRYATPVPDILKMFRFREEADITMLAALRRLGEASLSDQGRAGLQLLASDLASVDFMTTPYEVIARYLFGQAGAVYAAPFAGEQVAAQQRRLAAYQLLSLAFSYRTRGPRDPKPAFLDHIRRLEVLDEEKELRRLPAGASDIDAVQLMTVHASKGLEYPTVYVPSVSASFFPPNARGDPCPLPPGLVTADALMTPQAEEESLMFVGLSRAKDRLVVSRAKRYGGWSRPNPSKILDPISPVLAPGGEPNPHWTDVGIGAPGHAAQAAAHPLAEGVSVAVLEDYLTCPRRYYYGEALGLSRRLADTPYLRFHDVVRSGLTWLRDGAGEVKTHLDETWEKRGPSDHPAAIHYRGTAERMLTHAKSVMSGQPLATERKMTIGSIVVTARADHVETDGKTVSIQRMKAGRLAKSGESKKARYALLQIMVEAEEAMPTTFTHISLLDGSQASATLTADKRREAYDQAAGAIEAIVAGQFDPIPNGRNCPTCPFFFVCPSNGLLP
jgi:superfamily I DNA/RNA helicase/Zn-dependent peptidase ImmA (M78 family)/CRISPR/Cas system-associated exonuclease Cas4 (RecB family)